MRTTIPRGRPGTTRAALVLLLLLAAPAAAQDWDTAPIGDFSTAPVIGAAPDTSGWAPAPTAPAPAPAARTDFAASPARDFSLYRGSEIGISLSRLQYSPATGGSFTTLELDTRHTLWIAPFLGAQLDLGGAALDFDDTALTAGVHLHLMPEGGDRFGAFYLPTWNGRLDDRLDNYGVEGIFGAIPGLTLETRLGRVSSDDLSGNYFGARGAFALGEQTAVTARFQHNRLDRTGTDVNSTDAVLGAEYLLPGTGVRVEGGLGLTRFSGDVSTETDLRFELGATLLAFGPAGPRARTFGRQSLFGAW